MKTKFIPEYLDVSSFENGKEIVNPIPKEAPVGFKRPLTLEEQVKRLTAKQRLIEQFDLEEETEEEAYDFDIESPEADEELSFYQHAFASGLYDPKMDPLEQNLPPANTADKEPQTTTSNDASDDASGQNKE